MQAALLLSFEKAEATTLEFPGTFSDTSLGRLAKRSITEATSTIEHGL